MGAVVGVREAEVQREVEAAPRVQLARADGVEPLRRLAVALGELRPELPGDGKTPDDDPFSSTPEEKEKKGAGLPLLRDLGTIPGRALDLLDRGLGSDPPAKRKEEEPEDAEEEQSEKSRKTADRKEKELSEAPGKK